MKYLIWQSNDNDKDRLLNVLLSNHSFAEIFEGDNLLYPVGDIIKIRQKKYRIMKFEKMEKMVKADVGVENCMMINHMYENDDYGEIILDSKEPFAKKILEFFTYKDSLDILELAEDPISVNDISTKSGYPKATIYRRIPDLLDISMLIAVGREKDQKNHGKVSSWLYEKVILCSRHQMRSCN